jgi:glycyl-tRNA synthetase beta subunit
MGSPLSSTLAEIVSQYFKELKVKHLMETGEITYYRRSVDDIIIIFDQSKINEDLLTTSAT